MSCIRRFRSFSASARNCAVVMGGKFVSVVSGSFRFINKDCIILHNQICIKKLWMLRVIHIRLFGEYTTRAGA